MMENEADSGYLSGKMSWKALAAGAFEPIWGKGKAPAFVLKADASYDERPYSDL